MGLKLNKISDKNAEEDLKKNLGCIPRLLAKLEISEDVWEKLGDLDTLAEVYFETGALLYQQEAQKEEIISHLRSAAEYYVRLHSIETGPEEGDNRLVGDFENTIDLVVCFGEKELRRELAGIERWQYNFPEFNEYRIRADYLAVEKRFVADGVLDEAELQRLEEYCSSDKASERERKFVLPKIKGVRAVARGDEAALNRAIADLVESHKWEAVLGKYFLRYEGFICLPGMMLAQLGLERKMAVTVRSDYLPLRLLYQRAPLESPNPIDMQFPVDYTTERPETSYELLFSIFVNTTLGLEELAASLKMALTASGELRWQSSFDWSGNCVEVWPNEDYDESLVSDPEEGFLYYRYTIWVYPIDDDESVDRQINIAKHLKTALESLGGGAVICADFEELL